MRLLPSDPDIETIFGRIRSADLDLQPDFQRGEVWSQSKQRRLIDSILRNWHVPPIHVIEQKETKKQEVLDGQQRLAAIRDFMNGVFTIDGTIEPIDKDISKLNGMRYSELPPEWRRQFNQFSIRLFKIVDFDPSEPAELFFRLNQPVSLTSAEQRNAFFGPVRTQVKLLVDTIENVSFGFTNSRMAMDDVIARVCLSVEYGTILQKITSVKLAERYRSRDEFSDRTISICKNAVSMFSESASYWDSPVRLNKATLYSWLWLFACISPYGDSYTPRVLATAIGIVELLRTSKATRELESLDFLDAMNLSPSRMSELMLLYIDRSSSRVSDVSSVVARDIFQWIAISCVYEKVHSGIYSNSPYLESLREIATDLSRDDSLTVVEWINQVIANQRWGGLL